MRKSLRRPLMIAFICRTSVAWLSTWAFYIWCHFLSLPGYIWPQDINLKVFHSVSFRIEVWEVEIEEPQIGRLQLGSCFGPEWFRNWQFHILPLDKSSDCCWGITEVEAHIGQNAIRLDYAAFYHITLFAATKFIRMSWFSPEERIVKMGPTSSSGVNRVGDLWFFGTKVGCGPVMNYSIVGMESGGLRLIQASSIWGDQRGRRRATGRGRAALEVEPCHSQEQAAGSSQMSQMWKCSIRWICFF